MKKNSFDIYSYAMESGILNMDDVEEAVNKRRKAELLEKHPYSIWQGKDGRWRTHIADETMDSGRKLVVKSTKEALHASIFAYYENQDEARKSASITLNDLYPRWLKYKELHSEASTYITRINSDWKTYYLDTDIINIPIRNLDKLTLDVWAHSLIKDYNMTKTNYYNVTVILRQTLDYAVDVNIVDANAFRLIKVNTKLFRKQKKKPSETQVFSKEEYESFHKFAWEDYNNRVKVYELAPLALLFQFQTGLRLGELCTLRYEDLEAPDYIHVQRMLRRDTNEVVEHTKSSDGDRQVYLSDLAKRIISAAGERQKELEAESDGYIFSINGLPLTERSVADLYTKYCKRLDMIQKSSHKSRKTFISQLIDGHVNINTIREMVGHADERTTLGNYCFDRSTESEKGRLIENALSF